MKIMGSFVGQVTRVASQTGKTGKPYMAVSLEGPPQQWGEKQFRQRVEARAYRNLEEIQAMAEGDWAVASGEVDAQVVDYKGKAYARMVMTGSVTPVPLSRRAPPPPAAPTARTTAQTTTAKADMDDDSGVPF